VKVLTNNAYPESQAALKNYVGFGGHRAIPDGAGSRERFVRASSLLSSSRDRDGAFRLLDGVNNDSSRWHIVYDPVHLRVDFRTQASSKIKSVELARFDGKCQAPVMMLDIDTDLAGDVSNRFVPYTEEANRALVTRSLKTVTEVSPQRAAELAHYPSLLLCAP
jgi:hypothetical protein